MDSDRKCARRLLAFSRADLARLQREGGHQFLELVGIACRRDRFLQQAMCLDAALQLASLQVQSPNLGVRGRSSFPTVPARRWVRTLPSLAVGDGSWLPLVAVVVQDGVPVASRLRACRPGPPRLGVEKRLQHVTRLFCRRRRLGAERLTKWPPKSVGTARRRSAWRSRWCGGNGKGPRRPGLVVSRTPALLSFAAAARTPPGPVGPGMLNLAVPRPPCRGDQRDEHHVVRAGLCREPREALVTSSRVERR